MVSEGRRGRYNSFTAGGRPSRLERRKSTFHTHSHWKSVYHMPQTFQDTVSVACHLGIQYLWIDSLCIIQESDEDCSRESVVIGDIYANSFCTIAATSAPGNFIGFLSPRDFPDPIELCDYSTPSNPRFYVSEGSDFWSDINKGLLKNRA